MGHNIFIFGVGKLSVGGRDPSPSPQPLALYTLMVYLKINIIYWKKTPCTKHNHFRLLELYAILLFFLSIVWFSVFSSFFFFWICKKCAEPYPTDLPPPLVVYRWPCWHANSVNQKINYLISIWLRRCTKQNSSILAKMCLLNLHIYLWIS